MTVRSKTTDPIPDLAMIPGAIQDEEDEPAVHVNERVIDNDVDFPLHKTVNFWHFEHIPKDDADIECISPNANANAQGNDRQDELRSTMLDILNSPDMVESDEAIPPELCVSISAPSIIDQESVVGSIDSSLARSVSIISPKVEIEEIPERVLVGKTTFLTRVAHRISNAFLACVGKNKMPKEDHEYSYSPDSEDIMDYCYTKEYIMSVQKLTAADTTSADSIQTTESDWDVSSLDFKPRIDDIPSSQLSYGDLSIFTNDSGETLDSRVEPPKKRCTIRKAMRRIRRFFKR